MTVEEASTLDYLNRMGRGSKLFHRNKVTVFEEIHEVDSVEKKEKKKSLKSMMKGVLTKHNKCTDPETKLKEEQEADYRVYFSQKEKIAELLVKMKWMERKQEGKEKRIEDMEDKQLTFDERMQLKALKNSSKRLEDKIFVVNTELRRRRITINLLGIDVSKKKASSNETPEPEFLAPRCWEENRYSTDRYTVHLDPKQAASAKQYMDMSVTQKDRVYELKEKLAWMESKCKWKQDRILAMKRMTESLNFDQKIQLKGLKSSLKRLENAITIVKQQVSRRLDTVSKAEEFHKKLVALYVPNHSVEGSATLLDIELEN